MFQRSARSRVVITCILALAPFLCLFRAHQAVADCPNVQCVISVCPSWPICSDPNCTWGGYSKESNYWGATAPNPHTYVDFTATQVGCYELWSCARNFPLVDCYPNWDKGIVSQTLFTNWDCGTY